MNPNTSITIVVPAFNEEKSIKGAAGDLLNFFESAGLKDYEIIIVDDGSFDETGKIADELASGNEQIKVIHHQRNMGVGFSVGEGYKLAGTEYVSWFPGDFENQAEELIKCFKFLGLYDMINPYIVNRQVRGMGRNFLSKLFTFIINLSFGTHLRYTNGLVVYRRKIFDRIRLQSKGFFFQTEALVKAVKLGYSYVEAATELRGRKSGHSKALRLKSLIEVASSYLRLLIDIYLLRRY